jgi:hypothetical protein
MKPAMPYYSPPVLNGGDHRLALHTSRKMTTA